MLDKILDSYLTAYKGDDFLDPVFTPERLDAFDQALAK